MASSVGVKIEVDDKLFIAKIADIEAASLEAARLFVTQGGLMLEANVKAEGFNPRPAGSQRVSKSGRTYYVGPATPLSPLSAPATSATHSFIAIPKERLPATSRKPEPTLSTRLMSITAHRVLVSSHSPRMAWLAFCPA